MLAPNINETTDTSVQEFTQLIVDLLSLGQTVYQQIHLVCEDLCQEVMRATQGSARLFLPYRSSSTGQPDPFPTSVSFPVQFRNRTYGKLDIAPDPKRPAYPALPLSVAQLLANTCSSLLYSLELTALIEGQSQRLDAQVPAHLTKREREVLELICRANDQQAIAAQLSIAPATVDTHRKRIGEKLGVHSERDIPLAAFRAGLFSILDESFTVTDAPPTRED